MKTKNRLLFPTLLTVAFGALANQASAVDGTKADNALALSDPASWVSSQPPTSGTGTMIVDTTLANDRTSALGDNLSVLGINFSAAKTLTIGNTATKTLTIGTSGISSSGAGSLTFNNATSLGGNVTMGASAGIIRFGGGLTLTANQTWDMTGRRLELTSALTTGGNTLSITGTTGSRLELKNTTLGTDVTIGSVALVVVDNATTTINGVNNTNTGFDVYNGGTVNIASMGNLGGASSIGTVKANVLGTLNYTGGNFSSNKGFQKQNNGSATLNVTEASTTLSMSGNFNSRLGSHTGGFVLGGDGNLNLSGNILDGTTTTVTKNGTGTTTLSGTGHTYSSTTTVTSGKLTISGAGNINTTSGVTIGTLLTAATSEFNYNSSVALTKAVTFAGTGGTLSGTGTITPAVIVTSNNTYTPGEKGNGATAPGTQTLTGGVTFNSGSIFEWDIDLAAGGATEAGHDMVINAGGLAREVAGAGPAFNVVLGTGDTYGATFWDTAKSWNDVFSVGSLETVFSSITGTDVTWDSGTSRGNVTGQGYFTMATNTLSWTAVPEPTSALAGLLITAGLLRRRRAGKF